MFKESLNSNLGNYDGPCLSKMPEPNSALDKFNSEFYNELQNYIDNVYQLEDIVRRLTGDGVPQPNSSKENDTNSILGTMHNHLSRLSLINTHMATIVKALKSVA